MNESAADISECGHYRYSLSRNWAWMAPLVFVMLNPSTADATHDDPTIRRCIAFAKRENCGGIQVVNLYAFRATSPKLLLESSRDIVGPCNDAVLRSMAGATTVVCAWGANAPSDRARRVCEILDENSMCRVCFGLTKSGAPRHPLYVRADAPLVPYV